MVFVLISRPFSAENGWIRTPDLVVKVSALPTALPLLARTAKVVKICVGATTFSITALYLSGMVMTEPNYAFLNTSDECRYTEWRYAECRYIECHYAECHGTVKMVSFYFLN